MLTGQVGWWAVVGTVQKRGCGLTHTGYCGSFQTAASVSLEGGLPSHGSCLLPEPSYMRPLEPRGKVLDGEKLLTQVSARVGQGAERGWGCLATTPGQSQPHSCCHPTSQGFPFLPWPPLPHPCPELYSHSYLTPAWSHVCPYLTPAWLPVSHTSPQLPSVGVIK